MKFEKTDVCGFKAAFRGMRNPKNSWKKSDSCFQLLDSHEEFFEKACDIANIWMLKDYPGFEQYSHSEGLSKIYETYINKLLNNGILKITKKEQASEVAYIGPNDMKLAQTLIRAGSEHRKFLRQIFVTVDITAPLYWY